MNIGRGRVVRMVSWCAGDRSDDSSFNRSCGVAGSGAL